MRILVSVPAVSFDDVKDQEYLKDFVQDPVPFSPSSYNLDCFTALSEEESPLKLFGVNIPHLTLSGHAIGVAGPNKPHDELFVPPSLRERMVKLCGKYDKWRPYPAQVLSNYAINMAKRFTGKRCKMFTEASNKASWEILCYVEHAPASLIHQNRKTALKIAKIVINSTIQAISDWPGVPVVLFSPYGYKQKDGFICSNIVDCKKLDNWEGIKKYFYDKLED